MKKYRVCLFITFIICILIPFSAVYAADRSDVVVSMQIDNRIIEINGVDTTTDAPPVIRDGRTLVPIRAIIEAFGGKVGWDDDAKTVSLSLDGDSIKLTIDSYSAYLNGQKHSLSVAPAIIKGRTMLPIRFIAEGFNLGVAWDSDDKTVTIIRNGLDEEEYNYLIKNVPVYSGKAYSYINGNKPLFKDYEIIDASFEFYSKLDDIGRCDVCMASVDTDIMPTEERESISSVKPTGWLNVSYDVVPGGYLYNRCHLIGFQLTGENANKRNLITGTRYMNVDGMLPFENMVDDYIERTGNSVMYRVTPLFRGGNLVADGVLMEAYSVEDNGQGIKFCVFCYNVQPYIYINYATGESSSGSTGASSENENKTVSTEISSVVYRTPSGKRYHLDPDCGGKNSFQTTMDKALSAGLTPCAKCAK